MRPRPTLINARNIKNETPLLVVAKYQKRTKNLQKELIEHLIEKPGIDLTLTDNDGHDVVYYVKFHKQSILKKLYARGAVEPPRDSAPLVLGVLDGQAALNKKFKDAAENGAVVDLT